MFKENTFTSATIEVVADQRVISTGPYASCGTPMYAGGFAMLLGVPDCARLVVRVLVIVAMMPALIWRLLDEEKFLTRNLPGYVEYQNKVRYRVIPLIW